MTDLKIGIVLPNLSGGSVSDTRSAFADIVAVADERGFASVWTNDHLVIPRRFESPYPYSTDGRFRYTSDRSFWDAIAVLTWVAGRTSRVRLGIGTLIPALRHPVYTAKLLATLDALSDGRLTVGIGLGWLREEMDLLGAPTSRERGRLTDESIEIYRALWTMDRAKYQGRWFSFDDVEFLPKPIQRPHPPLWIGGSSEAALRRVVRVGQGWHSQQTTPEEIERNLEILSSLCEQAGRDLASFERSCTCELRIDRDRRGGGPAEIRFENNRRLPYITGNLDQVRETIQLYADVGTTHMSLRLSLVNRSIETHLREISALAELVADEVLPAFADEDDR